MSNPFLIEQAGMYLAYHRDHRNILTHLVGVPMITFSILILASGLAIGDAALAWLLVAGFALLFMWMQPQAGALLSVLLLLGTALAQPLAQGGTVLYWISALSFFVTGWVFQLVGHMAFEHRRPALTDNLLQIVIAPLFLVLEGFFACGQMKSLQSEIEARSHAFDAAPSVV